MTTTDKLENGVIIHREDGDAWIIIDDKTKFIGKIDRFIEQLQEMPEEISEEEYDNDLYEAEMELRGDQERDGGY